MKIGREGRGCEKVKMEMKRIKDACQRMERWINMMNEEAIGPWCVREHP